jgi:plasmid maintenance system antidote protein VapI
MANPNQPNLGQTQQDIRDIAAMTEDTFRSVADNIQSMFRDALEAGSNVSRSLGNDISNNLKALARQSSDSLNNQEKLNRGVLKQSDIQKQIEARMSKINAIENQINAARLAGMDVGQEIIEDLENTKRLNDVYINQLKEQKSILDGIDKEIGQLGTGIKGLGTFFKTLGFDGLAKPLESAIENTKAYKSQLIQAQREYDSLINKSEELTEKEKKRKEELEGEIKLLEKKQGRLRNIAISLKEQLTLTNATDFVVASIAKGFLELNKAQVEFTRETGRNISHLDTLNTSLISSVDYVKTATSLTQQFGLAADAIFSPATIESASKLQVLMGLSAEEAGNAASLSQLNGTALKDQSQAILDQVGTFNKVNKSALSQKGILKDVYNTSQTMQLSMGGNVKKITEANAAARSLGLSLKEVEGISDNLLDIETSIASEYEAEVLTGKQLNLEAARYYALQNDMAGVTKEIGKNQEIIGAFASGNRIQQDAIAKAMGMSKEQISQMIFQQQKLSGVTAEQAAKNSGMKLEDLERLSVQESITKSIEKMGSALAGPLETLASLLDNMMQFSGIITTVIGSFILLKGVQLTMLGIQKAQAVWESLKLGYAVSQRAAALGYNGVLLARQAIMNGELAKAVGIAAAYAVANPFSALAGLAVAAGVGAVIYSQMKDGIIDPNKGPVMTGEFGSVQLDPKDKAMYGADGKIKVGTNLNPSPTIKTPQQSTVVQQSQSIDYDKMAQALSKVNVNTNIDGVKVSNQLFNKPAAAMAVRKI